MSESERRKNGTWRKGVSGNPGGRPKGYRSLVSDLYRVLAEPACGDELDAMYEALNVPPGLQTIIDLAEDRQEAFARALVYQTLTGSWAAIEQVFGRVEPMPKRVELSGREGGPIETAGVERAHSDPEDARTTYMDLIHGIEQ